MHTAQENMIKQQIRTWKTVDDNVIDALYSVPRIEFAPEGYREFAYSEISIPIGHEQVMMLPREEARMLQALNIKKIESVLEIGTGTGFVTALLSKLAYQIDTVEIFPELLSSAENKLKKLQLSDNVTFINGDAGAGWEQSGPYDVVIITGSLHQIPRSYMENLNNGGRLFVVTGQSPAMTAAIYTRIDSSNWTKNNLFETELPPLLNSSTASAFTF